MYFVFTDEYVTVYGYNCYNKGVGYDIEFDNLHEAYKYCTGNAHCIGIEDGFCDMMGKFSICFDGIRRSNLDYRGDPKSTLCIYRKQEHHGNHGLQIFFLAVII